MSVLHVSYKKNTPSTSCISRLVRVIYQQSYLTTIFRTFLETGFLKPTIHRIFSKSFFIVKRLAKMRSFYFIPTSFEFSKESNDVLMEKNFKQRWACALLKRLISIKDFSGLPVSRSKYQTPFSDKALYAAVDEHFGLFGHHQYRVVKTTFCFRNNEARELRIAQ